jgi:hypothetical protein
MQMVNYVKTAFNCHSCQQTGNLQENFPLSPTSFASSTAYKMANGWKDPKNHKIHSNSSSDKKQDQKDAPTPLPSTKPSYPPTSVQKPTTDLIHQPSASTKNIKGSKILIMIPIGQPLHIPLEKDESNEIIIATSPLSGT